MVKFSQKAQISIIWNGAAATHVDRTRRIEHKFLMWLNAHCRAKSPSLSYVDLLKHFKLTSVSARRVQHDIMFIHNVFTGRIASTALIESFSLRVPRRTTRQQTSALTGQLLGYFATHHLLGEGGGR